MEVGSSNGVFESSAARYDAWYDTPKGRILLGIEIECLHPLVERFPGPRLEVGVGTGRFAAGLNIEQGIDPAETTIKIARRRGIRVTRGTAANLPFKVTEFGCVLFAFSLCFVSDPERALKEARRVLSDDGGVVLGLLLRGTPWADNYALR